MRVLANKSLLFLLSIIFIFGLASCAGMTTDIHHAKVVYIYDGDTIKLDNGEKVRYLGIDTPEMNYDKPPAERLADEAKRFNSDLVYGKKVRLEFDIVKRDKYNRLLAYVYVNNVLVNAKLIEAGLAKVYIIPPNVKYADDFLDIQRTAKEAKRGIWN
jgi:micrococcal nuclease